MDALYNQALMGILLAVAGGVGFWVARGIKEFVNRIKDEQVNSWVNNLVRAAAQAVPEKSERYDWVASRLVQRFPFLKGKDDLVKQLIEAAVWQLKQELQAKGIEY